MPCNISITNDHIANAIKEIIGNDSQRLAVYKTVYEDENGIKDSFKQLYFEETGESFNDITAMDATKVASFVMNYYNKHHFDVNFTANPQNTGAASIFNYTSEGAREEAKQYTVGLLNRLTSAVVNVEGGTLTDTTKKLLEGKVIKTIQDIIAKRLRAIHPNLSVEESKKIARFGTIDVIEKGFGDDISVQDQNVLALYKELQVRIENNKLKYNRSFFDELYKNSDLSEFRYTKGKTDLDDAIQDVLETQENDETNDDESDDIYEEDSADTFLKQLENKLGDSTQVSAFVDFSVRSYLSGLREVLSFTKDPTTQKVTCTFNTNNALGLPKTISANEAMAVLYSMTGKYSNKEEFIAAIEEMANTIPGRQTFIQMAEDLRNNPDFAYNVFRDINKMRADKIQVVIEDGIPEVKISNRLADKQSNYRFALLNDLQTTATIINPEDTLRSIANINQLLKEAEGLRQTAERLPAGDEDYVDLMLAVSELEDKALNDTIRLLKHYYITLNPDTILNYIDNANEGDRKGNIDKVLNCLRGTFDAAKETYDNFTSKQLRISSAKRHNKKIDREKEEGTFDGSERYIDVDSIRAEEYLPNSAKAAAYRLADLLLDYADVKVELNSYNVEQKKSSNFINNNYIDSVMKQLQSDEGLKNFGKFMFQSRQYDYSGIMVEHVDPSGNIINYGLFRFDPKTKTYVPTQYAKRLLKAYLLDGVQNTTHNQVSTYSKMTPGDYFVTTFVNFLHDEADYNTDDNFAIPFANYAMRTPSDAPKNFFIRAPRYSTERLHIIANPLEARNYINKRISDIPVLSNEEKIKVKIAPRTVDIDTAANELAGNIEDFIVRKTDIIEKNPKNEDTIHVHVRTTDSKGRDYNYRIVGTYKTDGKTGRITECKIDGTYGQEAPYELMSKLRDVIEEQGVAEGTIVKQINQKHPIFLQFKQHFLQELTDMASAINVIFQNEGGVVNIVNGELQFNPGFDGTKENNKQLIKNYHLNKSGELLVKNSDGTYRLVGRVFNSNKLVVVEGNENGVNEVNYGQQILERAFNLLYGGARDNHIHTENTTNGIKVVLTEAQEYVVDEQVAKFIEHLVKAESSKLDKYRQFIPDSINTDSNLEAYILNYWLSFLNFDGVFEGDAKFYKDTQTFLKRAKEAQGSGVCYGIIDYLLDRTDEVKGHQTEVMNSALANEDFVSKKANGTIEHFKIQQRNSWRAVTIANTIREVESMRFDEKDPKNHGSAVKQIIENCKAQGLSQEAAEKVAYDIAVGVNGDGYRKVTANDAQSYISFEEFIRRIAARGELKKYKPLIDRILDETKPLDDGTIQEFIQVQKNFYFDQWYNPVTQTVQPRQIKNSEFVLIPRLIRGTELETIANLMEKHGIDQINTEETSKAGNSNVLTLWDKDGNLTQENIDKFSEQVDAPGSQAIALYYYNYLYTQLETPQHVDSKNKAGIQYMKKVLDNLTSIENLTHKNNIFRLYVSNIKASMLGLAKEFGIPVDKNGSIQLDDEGNPIKINYAQFLDRLRQEIRRLGLDSNKEDFVELMSTGKEHGKLTPMDTRMPSYDVTVATKLENLAQAIFNNSITRQKLPGFHGPQVSSIGFKNNKNQEVVYKLKDSGKGRNLPAEISKEEYNALPKQTKWYYMPSKGDIAIDDELKYRPDLYSDSEGNVIPERKYNALPEEEKKKYKKSGVARYIEVKLPKTNFNFNRYNDDGTLKSDNQLLQELEIAELDQVIGYRIPTEGKQSIAIMKVVGFVDDAYGSTIVVPDGWVAQTGSDFDVDSIYGIHFNTTNEDGQIAKVLPAIPEGTTIEDYTAALTEEEIDGLSTPERENLMVQEMLSILNSDEVLEEMSGRSQFQDLMAAKERCENKNVTKLREKRSPYSIADQIEYQYDAMSGAKLKAFSVTRDTFCSVCNTVRPFVSDSRAVTCVYNEADGYTEEQIRDAFSTYRVVGEKGNRQFIVTHNTFGWSYNNKNVIGKLITSYSSQTTAHILDAIKEGIIPNVNDFTFGVYKLFPDLGSDYDTGVAFIMQPAITEIVNHYNDTKSAFNKQYKKPVEEAIRQKCIEILNAAKIPVESTKLTDLLEAINLNYKDQIAKLFNVESSNFNVSLQSSDIRLLPISGHDLIDRIHNEGKFASSSPVEEMNKLLFDLGNMLQFYKLHKFATEITSYCRVTNPDKFGAKQSIFETLQVFDTIEELELEKDKPFITEDGSFLSSIYPGIEKGIDDFMKNPDMGRYPSLCAFLKYASATSIKINRMLFLTQNPVFVNAILHLEESFTRNTDRSGMTNKVFNAYKNYIINSFYKNTDTVSKPVLWRNGGFEVPVYETPEDAAEAAEQELKRIYGYDHAPSLTIEDDEGNMVVFDVEDITKPTEEELKLFQKLSPAQKVYFLKNNSEYAGVFKYITPQLYNDTRRGRKAFTQTLTYEEDNVSIETVYGEFERAFFNTNPLVALTALDIIKYNYVVNGGTIKRNGVGKVIKNNSLYLPFEERGSGVIAHTNAEIHNIIDGYMDYRDLEEDFIRSHFNTLYQISKHKVKSTKVTNPETGNKVNKYEIQRGGYGIIYFNCANGSSKELIAKYHVGTFDKNGKLEANRYVVLGFDKGYELYKIESNGAEVVMYPLSPLEATERSEWSVNPSNNEGRYDRAFYKGIVDDILNRPDETVSYTEIIGKHNVEAVNHRASQSVKKVEGSKEFDVNAKDTKFSGDFANIRDKVNAFFAINPNGTLYVRSVALSNFIFNTGVENGSLQVIDGTKYFIQKANLTAENKRYVKKGKQVDTKNESLDAIMKNAQETKQFVYNAFIITKADDITDTNTTDTKQSSITELEPKARFAVESSRNIRRRMLSGEDTDATYAYKTLIAEDIHLTSESIMENYDKVVKVTEIYVKSSVDKLMYDMEHFVLEDGEWLPINDPAAINIIRNNPAQVKKLLKLMTDVRSFISNYKFIHKFNHTSDNNETKKSLDKIAEVINKLETSVVLNEAEKLFANEYLAKLSTDPRIQQDYLTLLDGYSGASMLDAWIDDLQETSSPIIQVISKEVMADIRAKDLMAEKDRLAFRNRLADIISRANREGHPVDYDHIIDKNGMFVEDYNQQFLEDRDKLREAITSAIAIHGENSKEHLEAKLKYDIWKLNHVNQELKDDYYQRKIELEDYMLKHFPIIYVRYKELEAEKWNILSYARNGKLDKEHQKLYDENKQKLNELTSDYYYNQADGTWVMKPVDASDPDNHFKGTDKILYSRNSSDALSKFLLDMKKLNDEYYVRDAKEGFDEVLRRNLDIVMSYEQRDKNGRITIPISELMRHDDYVEAKEWLSYNARWHADDDLVEMVNAAFSKLHEGKHGRKVLSVLASNKEAYDNRGVIDGRKFSDDEIKRIKEEQETRYGISENNPYSDRHLISCAPDDPTVFKRSFYTGMTTDGADNVAYLKLTREINAILEKYYDPLSRTIITSEMSEADINELNRLYNELDGTKRKEGAKNAKQVFKYIQENVETDYNYKVFEEERRKAEAKGQRYYSLWRRLNTELVEENGKYESKPNRYIYGRAIPKGYKADGTGDNSQVDKEKTEALKVIHTYCVTNNTEYYYEKYKEMRLKADEAKRNGDKNGDRIFDEWYDANHIYNPYTKRFEPIACWTKLDIGEMADDGSWTENGIWTPSYLQEERRPKDGKNKYGVPNGSPDMTNHAYKGKGTSIASNYKAEGKSKDVRDYNLYLDKTDYSNPIQATKYEEEVRDLFKEYLDKYVKTNSARAFLDKGYMVSKAKSPEINAKQLGKEAAKLVGWIDLNTERDIWKESVDGSTDEPIDMPFLSLLKSKDSVKIDRVPPKRTEEMTDEEYNKLLEEHNKKVKEDEAKNLEEHAKLLDRNWASVMEDFILKAGHYNAVQDNKYMLYYGSQMLKSVEVYKRSQMSRRIRTDKDGYITATDDNLQKQYENWVRRLVYNQWKEPNHNRLAKAANILQSLTSAKFMMGNVTGGIANVTVGDVQIIAEAFAAEHLDAKSLAKAKAAYTTGIPSYLFDNYKEKATSVQSAIIKAFNVVDYSELAGVVNSPDLLEFFKRARDFGFAPQQLGEHMMQNGYGLFGALFSNRLYVNPNKEENGRLTYIYKNLNEATRDAMYTLLESVLTEHELRLWNEFKEYQMSSPQSKKDYIDFRRDLTTDFANLYLSPERRNEFYKAKEKLKKEVEKDFNDDELHPTMYSQFDLVDGRLGFKKDSIFAKIGDDEAYKIIGAFKGRVISINKKIHGNYGKLDSAQLEKLWLGGLAMQYHKHLYPGIMKRWRRRGYYNEERGSIEKGAYASLKDFLAIPFDNAQFVKRLKADTRMTDSELQVVGGIQNIMKSYLNFLTHFTLYYKMMPETDKANMRRALGDFCGVASAICLSIALHLITDDDEDKQGFLYNLFMYEADRLASESFMYNPIGVSAEAKKLWSSPIAGFSGPSDLINTFGLISQWLIQGDDFDPYYSTGLYKGENKFKVKLTRQIPIYHSWQMLNRLDRSNKYYKLEQNMLGRIDTEKVANTIGEWVGLD